MGIRSNVDLLVTPLLYNPLEIQPSVYLIKSLLAQEKKSNSDLPTLDPDSQLGYKVLGSYMHIRILGERFFGFLLGFLFFFAFTKCWYD